MFKGKQIILFLLFCLIAFAISNKNIIIKEYLTNPPPTLSSLESDVETMKTQLDSLRKEVKDMKDQAQAGASQASVAKASISAMKNS
jgi:formaldehyde-activating enzyme involved in methanogenesis